MKKKKLYCVLTLFCILCFNLAGRKLKKELNTSEVVMMMNSKQYEKDIEVFFHKI